MLINDKNNVINIVILFFNVIILLTNVVIAYASYKHSRQKEFHDSLYNIKIKSYQQLIKKCHKAYISLDINSTPLVQIYDIEDKKTWQEYYEREVSILIHLGFDIKKTIYTQTMFLPSEVMDIVFKFSTACIRYVVIAVHFDTGLIIEKQDELHELFFEVVNSFRKDLGIEIIDESLKKRIDEV